MKIRKSGISEIPNFVKNSTFRKSKFSKNTILETLKMWKFDFKEILRFWKSGISYFWKIRNFQLFKKSGIFYFLKIWKSPTFEKIWIFQLLRFFKDFKKSEMLWDFLKNGHHKKKHNFFSNLQFDLMSFFGTSYDAVLTDGKSFENKSWFPWPRKSVQAV